MGVTKVYARGHVGGPTWELPEALNAQILDNDFWTFRFFLFIFRFFHFLVLTTRVQLAKPKTPKLDGHGGRVAGGTPPPPPQSGEGAYLVDGLSQQCIL